MSDPMPKPPRPRLYFLPDSFEFEALPAAFQAAYDEIIVPAYQQLVVAPCDALERATGITIVFLLLEELLDQQELGLEIDFAPTKIRGDRDTREKELKRHLRLISAKQTAIDALLRVRKLGQHPQYTFQ